MTSIKYFIRTAALALSALVVDARAASPRVYLASNGANSGACTHTAPCLTFAYALTQVSPKGEIVVLDTSSHAPFTVTKSVSIVAAPGAYVVVSAAVSGGTAITVTIPAADAVVLRGLAVVGQGVGAHGIRFTGAGTLQVQDCEVSGFTAAGIFQSGAGQLFVTDTTVRNGQGYGIRMYVNSGQIAGSIDRCRVENIGGTGGAGIGVGNGARVSVSGTVSAGNSGHGFAVGGTGRLIVGDSTAHRNDLSGFVASDRGWMSVVRGTASANGNGGFSAQAAGSMNIEGSLACNNVNSGIRSQDAGSLVIVANSMIVQNTAGMTPTNSGKIISRGNNTEKNNTAGDHNPQVILETDPH